MKKLPSIICLLVGVFLISFPRLLLGAKSPIQHLNLSVWSEYKKNNFDGLSQREKTEKLQQIFKDKLQFVQKHKVRRLIVKILNPISFEFFHPEKFDSEKDDNFYYWASQLSQFVEVEALFDKSAFYLIPPSYSDTFYRYYESFMSRFKTSDKPFGDFNNLVEKLEWLTQVNETYHDVNKSLLIREVVINPQGIGDSDSLCQNLINALDQYRFNGSEDLPRNRFQGLRVGILLKMDQKDLAFANLARFPLQTDLKSSKPHSCGVTLPSTFPSQEPECLPPEWREDKHRPLVDTVYLQLNDPRFIEPIYQNQAILPVPSEHNPAAVKRLAFDVGKNFRGGPFIKGPGVITNLKGTSLVKGMYTFFKTGSAQKNEGKFIDGQLIELRPPFVEKPIRKRVSCNPENNKELILTSTFSTTSDIEEAEYYLTPVPVIWTTPRITQFVASHIYYVLSTEFDPKAECYMGNWSFQNFIDFLHNPSKKSGFLYQTIYKEPSNKYVKAHNNLVLYDYSTIPNGDPYPECDWQLGNQTY